MNKHSSLTHVWVDSVSGIKSNLLIINSLSFRLIHHYPTANLLQGEIV